MDIGKLISSRKKQFWNRPECNDVSFRFPKTTKVVSASKTILALISPVFDAMFFGELAEPGNTVVILDVEPAIFEEFLRVLYTEELKLQDAEYAQKLFYVANKYEIPFIEEQCKTYFLQICHKCKLDEMRQFADMFCLKEVIALCDLLINTKPDIKVPAHWVQYKRGGPLPTGINIIGFDSRGYPKCIGRFKKRFSFETDILPGEFSVSTGLVTSTWGGRVYQVPDDIEILCDGHLDWVPSKKGTLHRQGVEGGQGYIPSERPGFEVISIGKVTYESELVIGKIVHHYKCLFIPRDNREVSITENYLILIDLMRPG